MNKKMSNNFFDDVLSILDEGTKIFNESFVEKMQDKIKNAYYKAEEWRNGKLINEEEKEWKDGKLIKDGGMTQSISEKKECKCNETCRCGKNVDLSAIEKEYIDKLKIVDAEVDKLRGAIAVLTEENAKLKEENSYLTKINSDYNNKFEKLNNFFKNF